MKFLIFDSSDFRSDYETHFLDPGLKSGIGNQDFHDSKFMCILLNDQFFFANLIKIL